MTSGRAAALPANSKATVNPTAACALGVGHSRPSAGIVAIVTVSTLCGSGPPLGWPTAAISDRRAASGRTAASRPLGHGKDRPRSVRAPLPTHSARPAAPRPAPAHRRHGNARTRTARRTLGTPWTSLGWSGPSVRPQAPRRRRAAQPADGVADAPAAKRTPSDTACANSVGRRRPTGPAAPAWRNGAALRPGAVAGRPPRVSSKGIHRKGCRGWSGVRRQVATHHRELSDPMTGLRGASDGPVVKPCCWRHPARRPPAVLCCGVFRLGRADPPPAQRSAQVGHRPNRRVGACGAGGRCTGRSAPAGDPR